MSNGNFYCKISYSPTVKYNRYKIVLKFGNFVNTASGTIVELLQIDEKRTLLNFTDEYSYCGLHKNTVYTYEYIFYSKFLYVRKIKGCEVVLSDFKKFLLENIGNYLVLPNFKSIRIFNCYNIKNSIYNSNHPLRFSKNKTMMIYDE